MRIVDFVGDVLDAHFVEVLQAIGIPQEAVAEVALHQFAGLHVLEARAGPGLVAPVREVGAFHQVGHPADRAFGDDDAHVRILVQFLELQPVGHALRHRHRHCRDPRLDRRFH